MFSEMFFCFRKNGKFGNFAFLSFQLKNRYLKINSLRAPEKFHHAPKRNFFKPYSNKSLCPITSKNILCFIIESFVAMETLYEFCKTDICQEFQWPKVLYFLANKSCINFIDSAMFVCSKYQRNKYKLKMRYLKHIYVTVAF